MNKLILIMGDLAAGKSTFSHQIADKYHLVVFNKDCLKEILGDTIGFTNREENLRLSRATFELFDYLFKQLSNAHQDLILESNFRREELERIEKWAKEYQYEILTIVLRGDIKILHERYLHRMKFEHRHPVHLALPLDDIDEFKKYIEMQRSTHLIGTVLHITANDFSYQNDERIWTDIEEFLQK